ncbi:MAG: HAD family phosphatase [Chlamydiae bacterium]|nr:HAD family phosphatase [Chlamydiota bacterium]
MKFSWIDKYQVFLFDFDGLLVNTEYLHFEAYRRMTAERGHHLTWDYDRFVGIAHLSSSGLKDTIYDELPALYAEEPNWSVLYQEKKTSYEKLLQEGTLELLPGVKEVLEALQKTNKKRAVVTNSTKAQTEAIKKALPILQTIPMWITREDYKNPKPHPECYKIAVEKLAQSGDMVVGFEDSTRGIKALLDAGVKNAVLICPSNHPQLFLDSLPIVPHFTTFLEIKNI